MEAMRVIVCGDREWGGHDDMAKAYAKMRDRLAELPKATVIIEGGAPGADSMGKNAAQELGFLVVEYPANWDHQHRAAGPIRNKAMLYDGGADLVLAFHSDIDNSKGTASMVALARISGVEVEVIE